MTERLVAHIVLWKNRAEGESVGNFWLATRPFVGERIAVPGQIEQVEVTEVTHRAAIIAGEEYAIPLKEDDENPGLIVFVRLLD